MEEDKDIQFMRVSLGMCGVGVSNCTAETILKVFKATKKMGGDFDLKTAAKIQTEVEEKHARKYVPHVTIGGLEKFYDDTVEQLHTRPENDPLTVNMFLDAFKNLIEHHKEIPF